MFCFDARKNASPIVPAALLILSLAFAAQAQTNSCQNQCRSDCEDSAIGKPAIAACIAKCDQGCQSPDRAWLSRDRNSASCPVHAFSIEYFGTTMQNGSASYLRPLTKSFEMFLTFLTELNNLDSIA